MECSVDGCPTKARAKTLCAKHYARLRKHNSVELAPRPSTIKGKCSVDHCESEEFCRTWCRKHYTRWYETGSLELGIRTNDHSAYRKSLEERFWAKVAKGDDHWLWTGAKTTLGYGMIWVHGRQGNAMAHRVSWELAHGQTIAPDMVIDHLCRTPSCVKPEHLEVVTVAINTVRGMAGETAAIRNRGKTHCPQGHPYSAENTYLYKEGRQRVCRTCAIERTITRRRQASGG